MLNAIVATSKKKKPQNPVLEAIERQKSPPKPKPAEKPVESKVKGIPNYSDKATNVKAADEHYARAKAESEKVTKKMILTDFGWAEAEIKGKLNPAKLQAARDEINADQVAQGKKPKQKLQRVEEHPPTTEGEELGKNLSMVADIAAKRTIPASEPIKNIAKKAATIATVVEDARGARQVTDALTKDKTGKTYESPLVGMIESGIRPASGTLGEVATAVDRDKSAVERTGAIAGLTMRAAGAASAPKQIAEGLIKAGVKSLESPLAKSLAAKGLESPLAKSLQDLPVTAKTGAQGEVRMADGSVKFMPPEKTVPLRSQLEPKQVPVSPETKIGTKANLKIPSEDIKLLNSSHEWQNLADGHIYRESGPSSIHGNTYKDPGTFWTNDPDLALGQGSNKGVLIEFRPSPKAKVTVNRNKPGWDHVYDQGSAEFQVSHLNGGGLPGNQISITIKPGIKLDPSNLRGYEMAVRRGEWSKEVLSDGSVKYTNTHLLEQSTPKPVTSTTQKPPTTVKTPENATSSQTGSKETTTSARKAQLADDRESLGLPELDEAVHKSFGESLSNAHKKGYTKPKWVKAETEKILKKPRALNDEETAGFTNHLSTIKKEHGDLFKSLDDIDDPETLANIRNQLEGMESDFDQISEAVKKSGTEKGRALVSQKLTLNDVNDIVSVKNAQKLAKGEKLTVKENLEAERLGKELQEANLKIKDLEDKNTAFGQMVADLKARTPGKSGQRIVRTATRQVRRNKAVSNIKEKWSGYKSETDGAAMATIPGAKKVVDIASKLASIAPDVKELVKTYVEEGIEKLSDIMPKLRKDTGIDDLTEDHINLILSDDYPKAKRTYAESEIEAEYNKAVLADLKKQAKRSEPAQKARLEKSIASFEKKIANEKLPPGKSDLPTSKEIEDLIIRRESAKIQHEDLVRQLKEKRAFKENPGLHVFDELTNVSKALVLSADISAPLTHGAFMAFSHPIMWARATGNSIKAFASSNARTASLAKIRANPYFDKAVASKVAGISSRDLTEPNFGGLLTKIPGAGKLFRASDRAFETFSASARMQLFEHIAKAQEGSWMNRFTKPPTRDTYNAIGEAVNTMTGKGTGDVANALTSGAVKIGGHKLPIASKVLIAPGYMVSRWKLALGSPALNAAIRKEPMLAARILKDYAKFGAVAYGGLKLAERHGLEVDFDPKSNNFMKMKLPNSKVYIDPFGGIFAPYKTIAQLTPGSKKDPAITAGFYATGKVAPPVRAYINYKAGEEHKKQFGKSYDLATPEGKKNSMLQFLPLSVQNGKEIMEEKGLTTDQRAALLLAAFFGTNVNVKESPDKK